MKAPLFFANFQEVQKVLFVVDNSPRSCAGCSMLQIESSEGNKNSSMPKANVTSQNLTERYGKYTCGLYWQMTSSQRAAMASLGIQSHQVRLSKASNSTKKNHLFPPRLPSFHSSPWKPWPIDDLPSEKPPCNYFVDSPAGELLVRSRW